MLGRLFQAQTPACQKHKSSLLRCVDGTISLLLWLALDSRSDKDHNKTKLVKSSTRGDANI